MVNAILNFLNQLTDVEKKEDGILKNISLNKKKPKQTKKPPFIQLEQFKMKQNSFHKN